MPADRRWLLGSYILSTGPEVTVPVSGFTDWAAARTSPEDADIAFTSGHIVDNAHCMFKRTLPQLGRKLMVLPFIPHGRGLNPDVGL